MSDKKKKGDLLELMVCILEKSFADVPTEIKTKYKLKDTHGIVREIDIYIESKVNNKVFKYAFECKNHTTGIALKDITDFHSKIADLGIQGFFVTTSRYQSGAEEKASALNIELFRLKKRPYEKNEIKSLLLMRPHYKISSVRIMGNDQALALKGIGDFISGCPVCSVTIMNIIQEDVIPLLLQQLGGNIQQFQRTSNNLKKISNSIGESKARTIKSFITFTDASITHEGTVIPYEAMLLDLKCWNSLFKYSMDNSFTYSYFKNNSDENTATGFSFSEFVIEKEKMIVGITKMVSGKRTMAVGSTNDKPEDINTQNMICLGKLEESELLDLLNKATDIPEHP